MLNTATVTGYTGPGATVTGLVLNNVHSIKFDFDKTMIRIEHGEPSNLFNLQYAPTTTVTLTKDNNGTAVVISSL